MVQISLLADKTKEFAWYIFNNAVLSFKVISSIFGVQKCQVISLRKWNKLTANQI